MGQESRTDALKAKHESIENTLGEEERRPLPDFVLIQQLKKAEVGGEGRAAARVQLFLTSSKHKNIIARPPGFSGGSAVPDGEG